MTLCFIGSELVFEVLDDLELEALDSPDRTRGLSIKN